MVISIHALREEGDPCAYRSPLGRRISIHALREEGDECVGTPRRGPQDFYPRPPRGGRPRLRPAARRARLYFYPRPPRGGRQRLQSMVEDLPEISIHALREEGDYTTNTPHGQEVLFLSTPSARRATAGRADERLLAIHFYPRPPRGGRRRDFLRRDFGDVISIHALREEGDQTRKALRSFPFISIHALREEGDSQSSRTTAATDTFLSTPSARRATRSHLLISAHRISFLSTPSARRATVVALPPLRGVPDISIHALREEGDRAARLRELLRPVFLSTPSARRATALLDLKHHHVVHFYPRPPRGGRPQPHQSIL